ncbi:terminase, partial [Salmonella enterica subsp. enterica serovar Typhimurium]
FTSFQLLQLEQKTTGTEELPFAFGDYDLIDRITA